MAEEKLGIDQLVERIHALIMPREMGGEMAGQAQVQTVDLNQRRADRLHLVEARQHRAAVAGLVDLLADIEEISSGETDRSVFDEMAHLFDDIALQARLGAEAMRRLKP